MAVLKFIIIFYGIYFILKLLFRNFINKITSNSAFGNFSDMNNPNVTTEKNVKPEGHITIHTTPKKDKKLDNSIGEYVDFEDVSEKK